MYTCILIDDEAMIRMGIKTIIDWDELGFEIIDEAEDSQEGLRKVLTLQPDLILVDLRMPGQNGIELIETLKQRGYRGKAIILTGYSEFEYARRAITLGVMDYLLKPIEETELIAAVNKVKKMIEKENTESVSQKELERLSKEQLCRKLLFHEREIDSPLIQNDKDFFNKNDAYYVMVVSCDEGKGERLNLVIESYFTDHQQQMILNVENHQVIIFKGINLRQMKIKLQDMQNKVKREEGIDTFMGVGRQVKGAHLLRRSYLDGKNILERRFLYRDKGVVYWEDSDKTNTQEMPYMDGEYIYSLVEIGNHEAMEVYFSQLKFKLISSSLTVEKMKGICVNAFIEVKEKLLFNYSETKEHLPQNQNIIDNIYDTALLDEVLDYMKQVFIKVANQICDGSSDNTMKRILNYIHLNYQKDLKLELLGKLFNYNSSYLGKVFKQTTNTNFNHYLDRVRIEKAKELIASYDYKVYEISEQVGYKSVDYFYSKFKKHVGMSPKEYKQAKEDEVKENEEESSEN